MCHSPLHPFLHALPKCEHHIHIEGSLQPSTLFTLAARNNISLPTNDSAFSSATTLLARYDHFTDLDDFLHYYYLGMSCLITQADFHDLGYTYLQKAHADGVVHTEIFFDPQAHVSRGVTFDTVIAGLREACEKAEKDFGITSLLICCFLRHAPVVEAEELYHSEAVQKAVREGRITGIGLDSSEAGFPPELFAHLWAEAQAQGLRVTMHAGEEGPTGAQNVATALFNIGCERVDHGRLIVHDEALMRRVAEKGSLLTLCPLSNVALRGVKSVAGVPVKKFLEMGVKFSINSDDPAYFGGFILDNYCAVQEAHGLEKKEWIEICRSAIEGSWCGRARKDEMVRLLEEVERRFA